MEATAADPRTRRFTVQEVLRMVEAGILAEDEPYELIGGRLVEVAPRGPDHSTTTAKSADRLRAAYAGSAVVREDKPLVAGAAALPEPDIAVVRGDHDRYRSQHPAGDDALLVVEVAVTSHAVDRAKSADYARAGVSVFWLVDVPSKRVEVHTEPQVDGRYRVVRVLAGDEALELPDTEQRWPVRSLFTR